MDWLSLASAAWLGILTAISPCPLATNIAAISFIGRQMGNRRSILFSGFLYTLGRTAAYLLLGILLSSGILASGELSRFLQKYMNQILGPLLIILGMILLNLIGSGLSLQLAGEGMQKRAAERGALYAFPLGFLFALSFCPVSAGLFFGALIPLAVSRESAVVFPAVYGVATAIPVVVFAFLIAYSSEMLGKAFNRLHQIEAFIRGATGLIFIITGIYYCLTRIYEISF